jgi:glyoxylase-like metal-dependent hydrolase (beta-lactamase superfamily II)
MAHQIQDAVHRVTDKPILYVVNTAPFGDHWFGDYAFPTATKIVIHRATAARMANLDQEKADILPAVSGDSAIIADVQQRHPDLFVDDSIRLDLGGRTVEVYDFGPGMAPGDLVVYVRDAKVAWTGNLVLGENTIPIVLGNTAGLYLETVSRLARALDIATIVPGHGPLTTGAIFGRYLHYLSDLIDGVRRAQREGLSLDQTLTAFILPVEFVPRALGDSVAARFASRFLPNVHRLNVARTYAELSRR